MILSNYSINIPQSAKCIAFGMGRNFWRHRQEIFHDYNIIYATDNNISEKCRLNSVNILPPPRCLPDAKDFDYILVIPDNCKIEIVQNLLNQGVDEEKIVLWFPKHASDKNSDCDIRYSAGIINAKFGDVRLQTSSSEGVLIIREIFIDDVYDCYIGDEDMTVIDIGMNIGVASIYFASRPNVKKVIGFEPFVGTYKQAKENISLNTELIKNKIAVNNFALSNHNATINLNYDAEHSGGMTIFQNQCDTGVPIIIKDASEILSPIINNTKGRILIKLDCEGSEYEIFESLERTNLFSKIDAFIMETHFGREQELKSILKAKGYSYYGKKENAGLGYLFAVKI